MVFSFFNVFALIMFSTNIFASNSCEDLLNRKGSGVDIYGDFKPVDAFKNTDLDINKLSIKVKNVPRSETNEEDDYIEFILMDGKSEVGTLDLYRFSNNDWGTYSGLNEDYKRRGIGTLMYLIGAEVVFRLYPDVASLQSWDGSVYANYMWEKLVRTGHAIKTTEDPESADYRRWLYILEREHITPKLSNFITQIKVSGSAEVKNAIGMK